MDSVALKPEWGVPAIVPALRVGLLGRAEQMHVNS